MQVYIRIFILCMVSGIICSVIHKRQDKRQKNFCSFQIVKTFVFYVIVFYSILIFVRRLSGKDYIILMDMFATEPLKIYLIYSIFLVAISAAIPIIIKKVFKDKTDEIIPMSVSIISGIYTVAYFFFERINGKPSLCIIAGGGILAIAITRFYKKDIQYCESCDIKKQLLLIIPTILLWIILTVLYLPNELYFGNIADMQIPYKNFIFALLRGSILRFVVSVLIFMLLICLLTKKQFSIVYRTIFAITFVEYVQSVLLNGKMKIMDGTMQEWSTMTIIVNTFIWILMIGVIVLLPYIIKKDMDKFYNMVCVYISLILLVSGTYIVVRERSIQSKNYYELTAEGRMELSSKHNVLVFILDWFDWQIADKIFEQNPDFSEPLKDFTWYRNMTSMYAFTDMSIPYLLTNVEWQYDMRYDLEESDYWEYAYENTSFLPDIAEQNYDIGIYTYSNYMNIKLKNIVRNYSDSAQQGWNLTNIAKEMIKCSKYKTYPFLLKNKYWYYADNRFFEKMRIVDPAAYTLGDDNQLYEELLSTGLQTSVSDEYEGAFRFYHLNGAHPPFDPDMVTKGEKCLNIVFEYLEQLKNMGLYDEATIIITADHGHNYLDKGRIETLAAEGLEKPSSPILFVKGPNQTNEDRIDFSLAPVSHAEMAATIMEAVSDGNVNYGDTFADIPENCDRERYLYFKWNDTFPYEKFSIKGDVRDWDNWHVEQE